MERVTFTSRYAKENKSGEKFVKSQEMGEEDGTKSLTLRYNPFQVFQGSKTPAGLYARQKWLGESDTLELQNDFHETVLSLMKGQSGDGSWTHSPVESIRRLFGLHLTLRKRTEEIDKALGWLMRHTLNHNPLNQSESIELLPPDAFQELPFTPGQPHLSMVCATLFLATIFQKETEPIIIDHYSLLSRWVAEDAGGIEEWSDKNNALRSFIVHPKYSEEPATMTLVDSLDEIQDLSGQWPAQIPFFLTINALAHLRLNSAHRQWVKALMVLLNTQNRDGSWGNEDHEWNTFLVVHALKNKGFL